MLGTSLSTSAQSINMRMANTRFNTLRYAAAIPLYEKVLKKNPNNREAILKLAESYRKVKDVKQAERLYALLAHEENVASENIWYYADMLAQNGKHDEAAMWYKTYSQREAEDPKGRAFANAYRDLHLFYKDSTSFRVRYIPSINSWQSDFSPTFYKKGLLFCSNRFEQSIIRKVYDYDQSAFVQLYQATDTASLQSEMNTAAQPVMYASLSRSRNPDNYTTTTSNDTPIPGNYGKIFLYDSTQYNFKPNTIVRPLHPRTQKDFHEGPATAFSDQDVIIYTKSVKNKQNDIEHLELYMASLVDHDWANEQRLPFNNSGYSVGHPALRSDDKGLYFVSDMPGGLGGTDIYFVSYDNGAWGTPVNVAGINTTGDELFPYSDANGDLYFSSNGIPGLGGLDIFHAKLKNNQVVSITNPGAPINSMRDDFGFIANARTGKGFLSSNRKRGFTDDDIYYVEKLCETVTVLIYDSLTQKPLTATAILINGTSLSTNENGLSMICLPKGDRDLSVKQKGYEVGRLTSTQNQLKLGLLPLRFAVQGVVKSEEDHQPMRNVQLTLTNLTDNTVLTVTTDANGKYTFPLTLQNRYRVRASKTNCGTNTFELSTEDLVTSKTFENNISMLCKGDIVRVDNIYYDVNKSDIRPDAALELDKLADLMWKYPEMRIELRSHTDSRSSASFNNRLSAKRAEAVVYYLASKGIVSTRMVAAGYGESLPLNKCKDGIKCSEEEYQQNRRTEFKVLSIK